MHRSLAAVESGQVGGVPIAAAIVFGLPSVMRYEVVESRRRALPSGAKQTLIWVLLPELIHNEVCSPDEYDVFNSPSAIRLLVIQLASVVLASTAAVPPILLAGIR